MNKRIIIFSDLHYGEAKNIEGRKLNQPAQSLVNLKNLLGKINLDNSKEIVILLGDIISKIDAEKDLKHIREIFSLFEAHKIHPLSVVGNHELNNLKKQEAFNLLGIKEAMELEFENIDVLFLDTMHEGYELSLNEKLVQLLSNKLSAGTKPLVIFSHAPLYRYDVKGNVWLETREEKAYIKNWHQVCDMLKKSKRKVVSICGHVHHNRILVENNVSFISLQSFSENISPLDNGDACQAYAVLEAKSDELRLFVYNDPAEYIIRI